MGFDINYIIGHVDEELICPICTDVLETPVQSLHCEHAFCRVCIEKWMLLKKQCPVDRSELLPSHLAPASRLMRNMLGRLQIRCPFSENDCPLILSLDDYRAHVLVCQFNPKAIVECKNCLMKVPKDELPDHNCIIELRKIVQDQATEIAVLKHTQVDHEIRIGVQIRELELLQYYLAALRSTSPIMRNVGNQLDGYAVSHWCAGLPTARVNNWGSVVSTPDNEMHFLVRNSLRASGCPMHLLNTMVEHCHEERWPAAMATLQRRRANQAQMTQFVSRLIRPLSSGRQCLCIFGVDNYHVPENLRPFLGITMIFVDGVEQLPTDSVHI
ncbi:E3 ubiquitin-protein ligase NRDP1 [Drosophila pseudoobscura]|uniref:E3 ubiquitin-protein ligase NRDP1 n=1 Tax=Drosophila pseudoobscura pseudoobscura TaxID=46245 RepID=A0A6I8W0E1_DROPS|nr:E3 ubiquitin-protein ligase NRDP1 [Drosophila pseudoobscura]XP_033236224.1 E3 ubiquitin-protein ligase NRDP1 [Drosophila pseudoobscura]